MPRKKKITGEIKEKVEEIAGDVKKEIETAGEKIEDATEKVGKKVEEAVKEIKEKIEEAVKEEKEKKETKEEKKKITKEELEEKAKKLGEKLAEEITTEEIKEKLEQERKTLVPVNDYVSSGIYIGTKVITPHMRPFVYRRRNDGIAIINTNIVDKKLKELVKLLVKYAPEDFIIVCKREAGWKAVQKFSELTGVRIFTKKYPAGILTNTKLPNFFETRMIFICDPWIDKNALHDAKRIKKKVLGLCDTNNYTFGVDFFVPCNNKSNKSLGLIFYILAREYLKARKIEKGLPSVEEFVGEDAGNQV